MTLRTFLFSILLAAFSAGCATNGYITSGVATVVGLDVSENPKTQIPHVKFGYARTGLYYVPTGKTAYGDPRRQGSGDAASNHDSVKDTPNVVSEIFVHSKFLSEVTISEKFAIGDAAVKSDAAVTNFANVAPQQVASGGGAVTAPVRMVVTPSREQRRQFGAEDAQSRIDDATQEKAVRKLRLDTNAAYQALPQSVKDEPDFYVDAVNALHLGGTPVQSASEAEYLKAFDKERSPENLRNLRTFLDSKKPKQR